MPQLRQQHRNHLQFLSTVSSSGYDWISYIPIHHHIQPLLPSGQMVYVGLLSGTVLPHDGNDMPDVQERHQSVPVSVHFLLHNS